MNELMILGIVENIVLSIKIFVNTFCLISSIYMLSSMIKTLKARKTEN